MSEPLAPQSVKPGQVYKSNESHRRDNVYRTVLIERVAIQPENCGRLKKGVAYAWGLSTRSLAKPAKVIITTARLLSKDFTLIVEPGALAQKPEQPFPAETIAA